MAELVVDGQTVRFDVHGTGEPVLTIANLAQPEEWWPLPYVPTLTDAGYQVITCQHLGPRPPSIPEVAADFGALVDHLDVGPVRVWGYSQGAFIAQELAVLRPDVVRAAALMATVGRFAEYTVLSIKAFESIASRKEELPDAYAFLMLLLSVSPQFLADDDAVRAFVELVKPGKDIYDDEAMARSKQAIGTGPWNRLDALNTISAPCLVITFERDLNLLPQQGKEVADAIPGSRHVIIPEVAHDGIEVRTEEIMKHLLEFFATV